jgi:para-nitrobenzyl esterase
MTFNLAIRVYLRAAVMAAALAGRPAAHEADTIVRVEHGFLQGAVDTATIRFQGVPYAAPPIGLLRWAPLEPVASWSGIRNATRRSQPCAQRLPDREIGNEDCFYLHVTVPRCFRNRDRKPVMVGCMAVECRAGRAASMTPGGCPNRAMSS